MRTSLAVVALAASLAAQTVTVTSTVCTDGQMTGYWTTNTGSTVPGQWQSLIFTAASLTQQQVGTLGFVVLSWGNLGCGVPLPLGPSCPNVPLDVPGPMIFDPASIILIAAVVPTWGMYTTHNIEMPGTLLSTVPIEWTAQIVLYQSPNIAECWQATGNAIRFSASL